MKICPTCLAHHADAFARCPNDGAALLALGAEPDPRLGSVVGGGYVLLDLLGAGGMGIVYRAWQRSTAREVAIKILRPLGADVAELVAARFAREAQITASLRSPNTVTIHDFGRLDDGDFFLVMELLHGLPADALLETRGALPLGLVREIGVQVCRSLTEAHARGVVHRDLKPSNIILEATPTGELHVKVLDFGVAKLLDEGTHTLTATGTAVGTVAYMSPEQVEGSGAVGPPTDLYALGVTLFELATGDRPFVADSRLALMFKHASEPPPPLRRFLAPAPEVLQLEAILERCLAKAPAGRFASAEDLRRTLSLPPLGLAPTDGPAAPRAVPPDPGPVTVDEAVGGVLAGPRGPTALAPSAGERAAPAPSETATRAEQTPPPGVRAPRPWLPFVAGLVVAGLVAGVWALSSSSAPRSAPQAGVSAIAQDVLEHHGKALIEIDDSTSRDATGPATAAALDVSPEAAAGSVTAEAADGVATADLAPVADATLVVDAALVADIEPVADTGVPSDTARPSPPSRPPRPDRDTLTPAPLPDTTPPSPADPSSTGPTVSTVRIRSTAPEATAIAARLRSLVERCASRQRTGLVAASYRANFVILPSGALHSVRLSPGDPAARAVEACVSADVAATPLGALGARADTRLQMTLIP